MTTFVTHIEIDERFVDTADGEAIIARLLNSIEVDGFEVVHILEDPDDD